MLPALATNAALWRLLNAPRPFDKGCKAPKAHEGRATREGGMAVDTAGPCVKSAPMGHVKSTRRGAYVKSIPSGHT